MNPLRKGAVLLLAASITLLSLSGCAAKGEPSKAFDVNADFETLAAQAKGQTVTFYGWGGDELRNQWLDKTVAPALKETYDITLERVPMDIDQVLAKLAGEKQANRTEGSIDMIWINGENFYSAKENGLLFGPFAGKLPSFQQYVDASDPEVTADFGFPIEQYEAPYGKAQMVLIGDSAVTSETPDSAASLLDYAKKYPGKVTYPAPPDFTGSAFVRCLIYDLVGYQQFQDMKADKDTVKAAIEPALAYLRELNPYLWNEGKSFPATSDQAERLFMDGELNLFMSYSPYDTANKIEKGTYTATTRTFLLEKGTVGNTNYMAIAANSPHKAAAMVAINAILSPELQATQFSQLKTLPVISYEKLGAEQKVLFDQVKIGQGSLPQEELLAKRLPEMPADIVPLVEALWTEEVVGK